MIQHFLAFALCAAQLVPAPQLSSGTVEADASSKAFVEFVAPRTTVYEREIVSLVLRVGVEVEFARANLLQLFVQPLDLAVQVNAPWFTEPSGARCVALEQPREIGTQLFTFALDDEVVRGVRQNSEQRDGREFAVLELQREFLVERSGELVVPAPSARFAFTTRFEPDFFLEPRATDWRLANVRGEPLTLRVEPLPERGRPAGFTGAVGTGFAIHSDTSTRVVSPGGRFTLRVSVTGLGNLEFFAAPRFDELGDFDVLGVRDEKSSERREFEIELSPSVERITSIPALQFAYFDTADPPQYRVVHSEPLPLEVRGAIHRDHFDGEGLAAAPVIYVMAALLGLAALGLVIGAIWLVRKRLRRARDPAAP